MSYKCPLCVKNVPLYKCPVCGITGHVDVEHNTVTLHIPPFDKAFFRKDFRVAVTYPSHLDCELAKPADKIDVKKLIRVE